MWADYCMERPWKGTSIVAKARRGSVTEVLRGHSEPELMQGYGQGSGARPLGLNLALSLSSCVTLGPLFCLSVPQILAAGRGS